ncbi:MAG: arsenate reductase ArsC [Candidatus Omnitrophica bacterium]|nr:arsenate reductase ArsC [Candidatus Omnitrophota bacterium]
MKKILFVCVENSCRSQMAEGFAKILGKGVVEAYSSGSKPSGKVNPDAVRVMDEAGIDINASASKGFNDLPVKEFDYVVTMGCGDVCPFVPAKEHIDWKIPDPKGRDMEYFRSVRDNIRDRVREFVNVIRNSEYRI